MNNKKLGTDFENEFVDILKNDNYWVHFITPSKSGAQPCDIVAIKNNNAYLIDCKTSTNKIFPVSRLEYNQVFAFDRWEKCGNINRYIAVKYNDNVYMITYDELSSEGKVELKDGFLYERVLKNN